jgi:GNAT superfamily N-acetyltransferase
MLDMLVKLYELPEMQPLLDTLSGQGIDIRRALAPEKHFVTAFIGQHFGAYWVSETEVAFGNHPYSCWIATYDGQCIGFASYDTSAKGFFGPTGVDEAYRGKGIGKALLLACLYDMRAQGYGYAIIGDAGPMDFYTKAVGAVAIPGSNPGVYRGMLRAKKADSN